MEGNLLVTSANKDDSVTIDPDATIGGTTVLSLGQENLPWQRRGNRARNGNTIILNR